MCTTCTRDGWTHPDMCIVGKAVSRYTPTYLQSDRSEAHALLTHIGHPYERFPIPGAMPTLGASPALSFATSSFHALLLLLRQGLALRATGRLPTGGPSMHQVMCPINPCAKRKSPTTVTRARWFYHMGTDGPGSPRIGW